MTRHLLYFHGSTLQSLQGMGKLRYLDALNPGGFFGSVHMVNLDLEARADVEETQGAFRFTAIGLSRRGRGGVAKLRVLREALVRLANDPAPSLVLADDANLLGATARAIARRARAPYALCIYYDNDLHYRLTRRPALGFLRFRSVEAALERPILRGAAGVYAQTRGYRDYALRHGAPSDRTHLGSWSVDDIFYAPPPPPHPDSRELLFVGRLHPLKFVEDLMAALTQLPSGVRLDVLGEGPDRARLERRAKDQCLGDRVRLLGLRPREELLGRLRGARALVVTQGVSAVVECLLSGRPVIAYDHECNAEFVRDGETGVLVPFRDVAALANGLRRLLQGPAQAEALGERGRAFALEHCSIASSLAHRVAFFRRCLG